MSGQSMGHASAGSGVISGRLQRTPSSPSLEVVCGVRETKGQHVEVRHRPRVVAVECLQHRILGDGEVSVDVKVRLHERDGGIHGSLCCARCGSSRADRQNR
jgi:hypothetical protein